MTVPATAAAYGNYLWFLEEIGEAMHGRRDRATWTIDQLTRASTVLERAMFAFYFPPPMRNAEGNLVGKPHQWSFLFPSQTLAVAAQATATDLPEDFAGTCREFVFESRENVWRIGVVNASELRAARNRGTSATLDTAVRGADATVTASPFGVPTVAAIEPKASDGSGPKRYQVLFYPRPHVDMELTYSYQVQPRPLSASNPWPLCGTMHTETILACCRAMVHELYNIGNPAWKGSYLDRLSASISHDAAASKSSAELFPVHDVQPNLTIDYHYLQRLVGNALGFGWSPDAFTYDQRRVVDVVIDDGLRAYYYPEPLDMSPTAHCWSFLHPSYTLATAAEQREYDLPSDFESVIGTITFDGGRSQTFPPIMVMSENQVRAAFNSCSAASVPQVAATIAVANDGMSPQTQKLILHPTPDATYHLTFQYSATQRRLSQSNPYPLGGARHGQAIAESCLAQAELRGGKANGPHYQAFRRLLATNIMADLKRGPKILGYNGDPSVGGRTAWPRMSSAAIVRVNGVRYDA